MNTSQVPSVPNATESTRAGKYLTFFLAGEEYGLEIMKVSEIIGMQNITRIPRTPDFIRGVINLRGRVIPITDLRRKFGMPSDAAAESCVIVVQVSGVQTGLVVDRVSDVIAIAESDIEDSPAFSAGVRSDLLLGIGKAANKVKLLLNIERVLSADELMAVGEASERAA